MECAKIRHTLYAAAVIIVVVFVWFAVRWVAGEVRDASLTIESDNTIDITPEMIQSIKNIGEWEFLSVADEEIVDTVRRGVFSDDHLVRIYYGTLRIGVNMHHVKPRWIEPHGDSVSVILPQVGLLDNDFIDETRTTSFYESGKWSAADREAMYRQAYAKMKANCLTPKNLREAQLNAEAQMKNIMRSLGFRAVSVTFGDKPGKKASSISGDKSTKK